MNKKNIIYMILTICLIVLLDQVSKFFINKYLYLNDSIILIKNFFSLTYFHNYGAAFGLLNDQTFLIIIISFIILSFLIYEIRNYLYSKEICISLALVIGGLIGNLIDRVLFGYVRDFLDFRIFNYNFPVFNLGDTFIVIGTGLLCIYFIIEEKKNGKIKSN